MASLYIRPDSKYYFLRVYDKHRKPARKSFCTKIEITEADRERYNEWVKLGKPKDKKYKIYGNEGTKDLLGRTSSAIVENNIENTLGIRLKRRVKFSSGFNEFIALNPHYAENTISAKKLARDILIKACKDKYVDDYTDTDYARLLAYFKKKEFSEATYNIHTSHLSPIFSYFKKKKYLYENIIVVTKPPKGNPAPITFKEMQVILKFYEKKYKTWIDQRKIAEAKAHYHLVYFMLLTGMRISSALVQKWEDIFFDEGILKAINVKRKNKTFFFPLHPELKQLLKEMKPEKSGRLFPQFKKDYVPKFFKRDMQKLKEDKTISGEYTLHNLRDTFATWMANSEVDRSIVKDLMDHSSEKVTSEFYTRIEAKTLLNQFKKVRFKK